MFRNAYIFLTFLLSFGLSVSAFPQSQNLKTENPEKSILEKTQGSLNLFMGGGVYQERPDDSTFVLLSIRPEAGIQFSDYFSVRSDIWINLNTARTQSRFQSPFFNTFNLMEIVGSFKPSSYFHLEAGSINQDHYENPLLIRYRSFPGAILYSGYESKKLTVKAKAQYAIPTSTSFETNRSEQEKLPTFQTQGVEFDWKPKNWLKARANVSRFVFTDLPSTVAFDSGRLGNQVIGTEPSASVFAFQFEGLTHAYAVDWNYSPFISQNVSINIVDNNSAPSDRSRSQLVSTTLNLDFKQVAISPMYGQFFAESDSTPALYSAFEYGRNNREGQVFGLMLDFKQLGFRVHSNYFQTQLIADNSLQNDMDYAEIFLEVNLANF